MKTAKQKATELIQHYYFIVYPYIGSDFMTGTESPSLMFKSAKKEALFLVENMLSVVFPYEPNNLNVSKIANTHRLFWVEVKTVIESMQQRDFVVTKPKEGK